MLIRFAVENYNSFKERQIFSMVAGKQTRHPSHCVTVNGKRLLKAVFLWSKCFWKIKFCTRIRFHAPSYFNRSKSNTI